jgi:gamma-glutamylputrescine oxidase
MNSAALPVNQVLWLQDAPDEVRDPLPLAVDVAIVGAGLAGISMALHVQAKGLSTVVLERARPAWGASGRNAGHVLAGTSEYYNRARTLMGHNMARSIWAFTLANQQDFSSQLLGMAQDTGYSRSGYLACATTPAERLELEESVALLREDGFPAEFWDGDVLVKRTGRSPFLGARFAPDDGLLHPAKTVWALADLYRARGGAIASRTEVKGVTEGAEGLSLELATPEGGRRLQSTLVVHCTNAWTSELLPAFKDLIVPVRGQMLATERMHKVIPMAMAANFGYEYWRQAPHGEVVLGGWRWSQKELEIGALSEELNPEIHQGLCGFLADHFPKVTNASLSCAWTGTMGFSRDGLPWVGEVPGRQGQYLAAGFTGHGFGLAWRSTACLAEEMVHGRLHGDLAFFRPRRAS